MNTYKIIYDWNGFVCKLYVKARFKWLAIVRFKKHHKHCEVIGVRKEL